MNVLHEVGLGLATVMPEPLVTAVAGAVGAVGRFDIDHAR